MDEFESLVAAARSGSFDGWKKWLSHPKELLLSENCCRNFHSLLKAQDENVEHLAELFDVVEHLSSNAENAQSFVSLGFQKDLRRCLENFATRCKTSSSKDGKLKAQSSREHDRCALKALSIVENWAGSSVAKVAYHTVEALYPILVALITDNNVQILNRQNVCCVLLSCYSSLTQRSERIPSSMFPGDGNITELANALLHSGDYVLQGYILELVVSVAALFPSQLRQIKFKFIEGLSCTLSDRRPLQDALHELMSGTNDSQEFESAFSRTSAFLAVVNRLPFSSISTFGCREVHFATMPGGTLSAPSPMIFVGSETITLASQNFSGLSSFVVNLNFVQLQTVKVNRLSFSITISLSNKAENLLSNGAPLDECTSISLQCLPSDYDNVVKIFGKYTEMSEDVVRTADFHSTKATLKEHRWRKVSVASNLPFLGMSFSQRRKYIADEIECTQPPGNEREDSTHGKMIHTTLKVVNQPVASENVQRTSASQAIAVQSDRAAVNNDVRSNTELDDVPVPHTKRTSSVSPRSHSTSGATLKAARKTKASPKSAVKEVTSRSKQNPSSVGSAKPSAKPIPKPIAKPKVPRNKRNVADALTVEVPSSKRSRLLHKNNAADPTTSLDNSTTLKQSLYNGKRKAPTSAAKSGMELDRPKNTEPNESTPERKSSVSPHVADSIDVDCKGAVAPPVLRIPQSPCDVPHPPSPSSPSDILALKLNISDDDARPILSARSGGQERIAAEIEAKGGRNPGGVAAKLDVSPSGKFRTTSINVGNDEDEDAIDCAIAELGNLIDYDEDRVTARHRTERTSGRVPSVKEVIRPIEKCHSGRVGPEVLDIATDVDDEVDLQEALASVLDKRRKRSQQLHTSVRAHVQVSFDDFVKRMMGEQKQVEDHGSLLVERDLLSLRELCAEHEAWRDTLLATSSDMERNTFALKKRLTQITRLVGSVRAKISSGSGLGRNMLGDARSTINRLVHTFDSSVSNLVK